MKKTILLTFLIIMVSACSSPESETKIFSEQKQALDSAKEVEGKILDAAKEQEQAIKQSTE